jgi:hypothetical protein
MITAPLLSMFVIPVAYYLLRRRGLVGERAVGLDSPLLAQPQRKAP